MRFTKMKAGSRLPERETPRSAGYPLYANEHQVLKPCRSQSFGTGIGWERGSPEEFEFDESRVGIMMTPQLLANRGISILGGLLNTDDISEIKVTLLNYNMHPVRIYSGDCIALLVITDFSREADSPLCNNFF